MQLHFNDLDLDVIKRQIELSNINSIQYNRNNNKHIIIIPINNIYQLSTGKFFKMESET